MCEADCSLSPTLGDKAGAGRRRWNSGENPFLRRPAATELYSVHLMASRSSQSIAAMSADKVSVAIIGAGASGLAAAAALYNAGVKNAVILEASNRIGGRINRYMSCRKDGQHFQTSHFIQQHYLSV